MRKLFSILVLSLVISFIGISAAQAITVDGLINPVTEWDEYFFNGTDPDEDGTQTGVSNIPQNYDIKLLRVWWDDFDAYLMTQLYGIPSFDQIDNTISNSVFYQWNVDSDGDDLADWYVKLSGDDVNTTTGVGIARIFDMSHTELMTGTAHVKDVVEVTFDHTDSALDGYEEPEQMFMLLENQGGPQDDRLPAEGWITKVPEPSSMMLLGLGLFGFVGGTVRRRFKA